MKQNIVNCFFEQGHLLTPEVLEKMSKNESLTKKTYKDFIIEKTDDIKVIKSAEPKLKEIKTQDFVNFYKSKYEKMKTIITSRIKKDFVSLNNIQNDCYVIGIVKNIREKEIELEDMTTTKKLNIENINGLELDDVAAFHLVNNECKEIFYPDIPVRAPTFSEGKVCFTQSASEDFLKWFETQNVENLVVLEPLKTDYCKNKNIFISEFSMIEINKMKILIMKDFDLTMIKKRHLGKTKDIFKEDFLVLDEVPDIVYTNGENKISNYKSITIINGSAIVDFSTREATFVEF